MSVALFAVEGNDIYADTKITFSEPVSTEEFYQKYWRKAIKELNIKLFKDGSQFGYPNLNNVLSELKLLKTWAIENLTGNELEYMKKHTEHLQKVIPAVFKRSKNTILYIF